MITLSKKFKKFLRLFVKQAADEDLFFNASAITFNLFICAIPFTLLLISILGYLLSFEEAFAEVINLGRDFFPNFQYQTDDGDVITGAATIQELLMPLVRNRRIFGLVGFGILIFFSQGLFKTVKHVIFDIFEIKDHRHPVMEMIYNFLAMGVVGGVFVFSSIAIFFISIFAFNELQLPFVNTTIYVSGLFKTVNIILPFLFTLGLFYVIYRYLSEKRVSKQVAFVGSLVYTFLFETARAGVGLYLDYAIEAYEYFYQGYTLLVVIFFWTFYSATIFVVSTVAARAYQDVYTSETAKTEENPYTLIS